VSKSNYGWFPQLKIGIGLEKSMENCKNWRFSEKFSKKKKKKKKKKEFLKKFKKKK